MTEQEIREAAIGVVTKIIADLRCCSDANAPERLDFFERLLTRIREGAGK
jgi:hypothetical protein